MSTAKQQGETAGTRGPAADQPAKKPVKKKTLMRAKFSELVALNFRIDPKILLPRVPKGMELDYFQGETYVSLVAMMLRDVRVWGIPIHIASGFEEINLRFYVRRETDDGYRSGSCFIKDYVSGSAAAFILSNLFKSKFGKLKMKHANSGFPTTKDSEPVPIVDYQWKVDDHWNRIRIKGRSEVHKKDKQTKVGYILQHNYNYSSRDGKTLEYPSDRSVWTVWDAAQANFTCDVKPLFGQEFVKALSSRPASVFVAFGSDVNIYRPTVIT